MGQPPLPLSVFTPCLPAVAADAQALAVTDVILRASLLDWHDVVSVIAGVHSAALSARERIGRQHSLPPSSVPLACVAAALRWPCRCVLLRPRSPHLAHPGRRQRSYFLRHPPPLFSPCWHVPPSRKRPPAVARCRWPAGQPQTMSGSLPATSFAASKLKPFNHAVNDCQQPLSDLIKDFAHDSAAGSHLHRCTSETAAPLRAAGP